MPTNVKLYLTTGETITEDDILKISLDSIAATNFPPSSHDHDDLYYTENEVDTKIADVKIGGRNLLVLKDFIGFEDSSVYYGLGDNGSLKIKNMDYRSDTTLYKLPVSPNAPYTISTSNALVRCQYFIFDSSGSIIYSNDIYGTATFITPSQSFTMSVKFLYESLTNIFVKLERGNKATDWTPAPEDMVSKVELSTALASKVPITRKIADLTLGSDITSTSLTSKLNLATDDNKGLMPPNDKAKLDRYPDPDLIASGTMLYVNEGELVSLLGGGNGKILKINTVGKPEWDTLSIAGLTLDDDITAESLTGALDLATTTKRGVMSYDDKTKLNGLTPTQDLTDNSTKLATTSLVWGLIGGKRVYHLTQSEYIALGSSKDTNGIYFIRGA